MSHAPAHDGARLAALLQAVAEEQDKKAFADLFTHFGPRIKAYLIKSGADEATAEELAQETMLTVWHKAKLFNRRKAAASTWVFTIARNKRIDRLRKRRRPEADLSDHVGRLATPQSSRGGDYSWEVVQGETTRLSAQLAELPEEQAMIIRKFYAEDKSHSMIAEELGLKLGTVKSRLRLALSRLRLGYRTASPKAAPS